MHVSCFPLLILLAAAASPKRSDRPSLDYSQVDMLDMRYKFFNCGVGNTKSFDSGVGKTIRKLTC